MTALQWSALALGLLDGVGLLLHSRLLQTGRIRAGMFCFYTNLSNLLLIVYQLFLFLACFRPSGALYGFLADVRVSCSMALCVWVTHLVYHFVLVPDAKRRGKKFADFGGNFGNICVHYAAPLLAVFQWLLLADKTGLSYACALWWLLLPLLYTAFALLRARGGRPIGHTGLVYPYPFMDLARLGWRKFLLSCLGMLGLFFLLGCLLVFLGGLMG